MTSIALRRALLCQRIAGRDSQEGADAQAGFYGRPLTCAIVCEESEDGDRTAPNTIMLVPAGDSKGLVHARDGRIFRVDRDKLISNTKEEGIDLMLDRDHESFFTLGAVPAAGWIVASSIRKNGRGKNAPIVADVIWTEDGRADVASLRFRFISPAFDPRTARFEETKSGDLILNVDRLENAGIVNQPALRMPALAHKEPSKMDLAKLLFALGLDPETSFESALDHVKSLREKAVAPADSVPQTEYAELATQFKTLKEERDALRDEKVAGEASALVADALRAEKITPAEEGAMLELAKSQPATFKKIVEVRPAGMFSKSNPDADKEIASGDSGANGLTDDERFVARKLGIPEEDYLAQKVANAKKAAAS